MGGIAQDEHPRLKVGKAEKLPEQGFWLIIAIAGAIMVMATFEGGGSYAIGFWGFIAIIVRIFYWKGRPLKMSNRMTPAQHPSNSRRETR